jgi:hypothetical protein
MQNMVALKHSVQKGNKSPSISFITLGKQERINNNSLVAAAAIETKM